MQVNNKHPTKIPLLSAADGLPSPPAQKALPLGVHPMTKDQTKYCAAMMRNLKKHRDAAPLLNPVDYVKLNIPDYPQIITRPMDLFKVDQKLNQCEYAAVDEFIADVRLVFNNCFKYNGPEAMISVLCQNVESAFEKGLRQMPPSTDAMSPPLSQHGSPQEEQPDYYDRPKREIHMPHKDYPETFTVASPKGMKYCLQTVKELKKQKYRHLSFPFLYPVDPVALNIPDYPTIVQHPMDLHTIEQKLNKNDYKSPDAFAADIALMFDNCYLYNPPQLPIHAMAKQFQAVFEDKWNQRPATDPVTPAPPLPSSLKKPRRVQKSRPEPKEEDKIAELERHIATISQQIESIKSSQHKKPRKRALPKPSSKKEPLKKKKRMTKYREMSSDEEGPTQFTFQQKKDLSEAIAQMSSDRLSHVAQIIQASMPHLGMDEEEIELDIDSLDLSTLTQLHNYVYHPTASLQKKPNQTHTSPQDSSSESDNSSVSGSEESDSD